MDKLQKVLDLVFEEPKTVIGHTRHSFMMYKILLETPTGSDLYKLIQSQIDKSKLNRTKLSLDMLYASYHY